MKSSCYVTFDPCHLVKPTIIVILYKISHVGYRDFISQAKHTSGEKYGSRVVPFRFFVRMLCMKKESPDFVIARKRHDA